MLLKQNNNAKVMFHTIIYSLVMSDLSTLYFKLMTFRIQWEGLHNNMDLFPIWACKNIFLAQYGVQNVSLSQLPDGNKTQAPTFWELEWHETWAMEILVSENYFFNLCKVIPIHD